MSKQSALPSKAGGTRSSLRRSDVSPLDDVEELRRQSGFANAAAAGEFLHKRGYVPSKDPKELDAIAVSNALLGIAAYAQGRELVEGINALAMVLSAIHMEQTTQVLASRLAETTAEKLNEEIEAQMTNLEKQLDEKTSVVLSMVDQAYSKIQQATATLERSINDATAHTSHTPHTTPSIRTPDAAPDSQTYASVVHSHLPTSHLSNLARQKTQRKRILLDSIADSPRSISDLSEAQIVAKANIALEQMGDETTPAGQFTGARILRNGGVLIEANEEALIAWVQDDARREEFQNAFDGGQARIKDKTYSVIIEFVPIAHKTGNQTEYRHIEGVSHIDPGHLVNTKWMKPIERRTEGQRTAHLLAKFKSASAANIAIREGLTIAGKLVYGRKSQQEPRRCLKCQQLGQHFAAQCHQDGESCGTCGKNHATKDCSEQNSDHFWCVNCKVGGHASWDRMCPRFREEAERLKRRDPESTYRFYPIDAAQWTWEQNPTMLKKTFQQRNDGEWATVPGRRRGAATQDPNPPVGSQGRGWSLMPSRQNTPTPGTQDADIRRGTSAGPNDGNRFLSPSQ